MQGMVTFSKSSMCPLLVKRTELNGNPALGFEYTSNNSVLHRFYLGIETSGNKLYVQHFVNGATGEKVFITEGIPEPV